MVYLTNSISLGMLPSEGGNLDVASISAEMAAKMARFSRSIVGHADTATLFAKALGYPVEFNRESVTLKPGDRLIVGQYRGPRLPEGAEIAWLYVRVERAGTLDICGWCCEDTTYIRHGVDCAYCGGN